MLVLMTQRQGTGLTRTPFGTVKRCSRLPWSDTVRDYCHRTTLHGLKYVGDENLHITERLFWLVMFLLAVAAAAYYISFLYEKWDLNPVIVSLSAKATSLNEFPFPAVTICNMNRAKRSIAQKLMDYGSGNTEDPNYSLEYRLLRDLCALDSDGRYDEDNQTSKWDAVQNFLVKVGQPCHEMLVGCSYAGQSYDCTQLFNPTITDEGICCSFNKVHRDFLFRNPRDLSDLNVTFPIQTVDWTPESGYPANSVIGSVPFRPRGPGAHLGLRVVLDAQIDEYFCSSTASIGYKLLLHSPVETPKIAQTGNFLTPGEEIRVSIRPSITNSTPQLRYIPKSKRQCVFSSEVYLKFYRTYTQRNCALECEANYTLEICKCVLSYMPKDARTPICGYKDENCANNAKRAMELSLIEDGDNTASFLADNPRPNCKCLPACSEISYHGSQTFSKMSSPASFYFPKDYIGNYSNETYFRKNMAVVHVFFRESQFTSQLKGELFGFIEFLSSTGGLLGLFLGFSFLSAAEVFYYLTLRLWCTVSRAKGTSSGTHGSYNSQFPFTQ
ncbi:pickpocket protein 28-like [Anabrus simplex]|uniref:pickpocket protein 28-like n=1 Tax=Anabrus simplex TaxID=316456 RepID=UPI0035A33430